MEPVVDTRSEVHWFEGMFLRPQHFQADRRYVLHAMATGDRWAQPFNWGLRYFEFDRVTLKEGQSFQVTRLHARMYDGTIVEVPERGTLAALDLKEVMKDRDMVDLYLAIPVLSTDRVNIADPRDPHGSSRYRTFNVELYDENVIGKSHPIDLRGMDLSIRPGPKSPDDPDTLAGYDKLLIARIKRSSEADRNKLGEFEVDRMFIPPLVACEAWPWLVDDVLKKIRDRVSNLASLLADLIRDHHISVDSRESEELRLVRDLDLLNQCSPILDILCATPHIHPLMAYIELSSLIGKFALYGPGLKSPKVPGYDHQNLGQCVGFVAEQLQSILTKVGMLDYSFRELFWNGIRFQMESDLDSLRDAAGWKFYLAMFAAGLSETECSELVGPAFLNLRVASPDKVDQVFRGLEEGVGLAPLSLSARTLPPRLPIIRDYYYFELTTLGPQWTQVRIARRIAVQIGTDLVDGSNNSGDKRLSLNWRNRSTRVGFRLYAIQETTLPATSIAPA
jgi:type VI secretion system protein ImpJ